MSTKSNKPLSYIERRWEADGLMSWCIISGDLIIGFGPGREGREACERHINDDLRVWANCPAYNLTYPPSVPSPEPKVEICSHCDKTIEMIYPKNPEAGCVHVEPGEIPNHQYCADEHNYAEPKEETSEDYEAITRTRWPTAKIAWCENIHGFGRGCIVVGPTGLEFGSRYCSTEKEAWKDVVESKRYVPANAPTSVNPSPVKVGEPQGIYVASRASIPERSAMWREFRVSGMPITSTWIDEAGEGETGDMTELWMRIQAEIFASRALILYVEPNDIPLKGALIEVGMALAAGIPIFAVLPGMELEPRSMRPIGSWLMHPQVTRVDSIEAAWNAAMAAKSGTAPISLETDAQYLAKAAKFMEHAKRMDDAPIPYMIAAAFKNEDRAHRAERQLRELLAKSWTGDGVGTIATLMQEVDKHEARSDARHVDLREGFEL